MKKRTKKRPRKICEDLSPYVFKKYFNGLVFCFLGFARYKAIAKEYPVISVVYPNPQGRSSRTTEDSGRSKLDPAGVVESMSNPSLTAEGLNTGCNVGLFQTLKKFPFGICSWIFELPE
jgi:hypothetical protein